MWARNMNGHLMASYVGNVYTKNYQNLVILLVLLSVMSRMVFGVFCLFQRRFHVFWFPQVVQKHILDEVETWIIDGKLCQE